jgi:glycosyltransferase involved in cell wall biosynthesis
MGNNGQGLRIGVDARSCVGVQARGEGKTLLRVYAELARMHPQWDFTLYGERPPKTPIDFGSSRIHVKTFDLPGHRYGTWDNVGLPWHAWRDGVDVLHCFSSGAPMKTPAPVVMTVHDIIPLVFDDGVAPGVVKAFRRQLVAGLRSARRITAVSEHTRKDLCEMFGVAPERITIVPPGIDVVELVPEGEPKRPSGFVKPYALIFGGNARRKNTLASIRAFIRALDQGLDLDLVVVGLGRGGIRTTVEADIARSRHGQRIHVLDFIPQHDLDAIFRGAEFLIYLSLYEGFGLPVLEAMNFGVPVLGSDRTSIPEVVAGTALLVNPEDEQATVDAIARMATDAPLRARLRQLGKERSRQFTWENTARGYSRVLMEAAG